MVLTVGRASCTGRRCRPLYSPLSPLVPPPSRDQLQPLARVVNWPSSSPPSPLRPAAPARPTRPRTHTHPTTLRVLVHSSAGTKGHTFVLTGKYEKKSKLAAVCTSGESAVSPRLLCFSFRVPACSLLARGSIVPSPPRLDHVVLSARRYPSQRQIPRSSSARACFAHPYL